MKRIIILSLVSLLVLSGCKSNPKKIESTKSIEVFEPIKVATLYEGIEGLNVENLNIDVVSGETSVPLSEFQDQMNKKYKQTFGDDLVFFDDDTHVIIKDKKRYEIDLKIAAVDSVKPELKISFKDELIPDNEFTMEVQTEEITFDAVATDLRFNGKPYFLTPKLESDVDMTKPGSYSLTVSANDGKNEVKRVIKVIVKDLEENHDETTNNVPETNGPSTKPPTIDTPGQGNVSYTGNDLILVNKQTSIGRNYVPDLVYIPASYAVSEGYEATERTTNAFVRMVDALYSDTGLWLLVTSSYRDYDFQNELYTNYVASYGQERADLLSAKPGQSEHQTGLVVDVVTPDGSMMQFGETRQSTWVNNNAHRFGFIVRYQAGKESITGYQPEPWHLRFVGVDAATAIYNQGITLDEYLR